MSLMGLMSPHHRQLPPALPDRYRWITRWGNSC